MTITAMARSQVLALIARIVALSLIGAPLTMADWAQPASFSTDPIDETYIGNNTPVLEFEALQPRAQSTVRRAIESPDGSLTVYGYEDWPDRFRYADDHPTGGFGLYVIAYNEQYYQLTTMDQRGFLSFIYNLFQLPFIIYGVVLAWIARETWHQDSPAWLAGIGALPGVAFHRLGPEFDFPVVSPIQFIEIGVVSAVLLTVGLYWQIRRSRTD